MTNVVTTVSRSPIGLTIQFRSSAPDKPQTLESPNFVDDTFRCTSADVDYLLQYLQSRRPDVLSPLTLGRTVSLFVPQTDPPVMRITRHEARAAYFTLGELVRWRFMRTFTSYPLKAHQAVGVDWLRQNRSAILADDMGLGKTLQAIAALEIRHRAGEVENALVLCPKSLIGVWEAEIGLWAPRLCTVALHSSASKKTWATLPGQCQVTITNYEALRTNRPAPGAFDVVILDEVHKLKNAQSLNYAACYALEPRITWGLSGTPLENRPSDLTAILHLLNRKRISLSDDRLPLGSLRSVAAGHILRRSKDTIADELPQILEKVDVVPLTPAQRARYLEILREGSSDRTVGGWISTFNKLRDVCDYEPSSGASSKLERAMVILRSTMQLGEKTVVFSWRLEPLRLLRRLVAEEWGDGVVGVITGQTSSPDRARLVASFQTADEPSVLLCSMRATAEGLTLTAANHVVFLNEWWNPAVNAQARDRVNRIGQRKDVFVYRLRTSGTVEAQLGAILEQKSALFDDIVNRLSMQESPDEPVPERLVRFLQEGT